MKVVIVEDEKPAARRLKRLLEKEEFDVAVMLHSVSEAIEWFKNNNQPDLVFLDIQLSDGLSFEIFENFQLTSAVIFTTAYDKYALEAFKLNSIDYLLKPIDTTDLQIALKKHQLFKPQEHNMLLSLNDVKTLLLSKTEKSFKDRFTVKVGQQIKMLPTHEIECFYSEEKATFIHTNTGRDYITEHTLEQLEQLLNPEVFFRINRKFFVNINAIKNIVAYSNSRLKINLTTLQNHELIVSRERVKNFKKWLG